MFRVVSAGLFLTGLAMLNAQPAPDADATAGQASQEVVVLPEFRVATENDGSYLATESSSGTRIAMPISSLPYSIQVLTSEFMQDYQLFNLSEQAPFISGMAPGDPAEGSGSGNLIRGFGVPYFRNGFFRTQAPESSSIDRVETIKGPQSAVYGRVSPGGVINYISKKPRAKFSTGVWASYGSYNNSRVEANVTGPLVKGKLFYRLDLGWWDTKRNTDFYFDRGLNISGGVTYKAGDATTLSLEFETTDRMMNAITTRVRYLDRRGSADRMDWIISGSVWDLPNRAEAKRLMTFSPAGSEARVHRLNDSYYLEMEHRFSRTLSLRANLNYTKRKYTLLTARSPLIWDPAAGFFTDTNRTGLPRVRDNPGYTERRYGESGGQIDLTKIWHTGGATRQRSLLTFDYFRNTQNAHQWSRQGAALNDALASRGLAPNEINAWKYPNPFSPDFDYAKYSVLPAFNSSYGWISVDNLDSLASSIYNEDLRFYGALFNHTVELLDGRLNLLASVRQDYSEIVRDTPMNPNENLKHATSNVQNFSHTTGLTLRLIGKQLILFGSYGTSFNPQPTVDPNVGKIYGNTTAKGGEAGFKGLLMNERFSYTLSLYRVRQRGEVVDNPVSLANPSDMSIPRYMEGGETLSRGGSIDISGRLLPGLSMIGNFSIVNSTVAKNEANPGLVGTRRVNIPRRTFGLAATWQPSFVKGLRLGANYKYVQRRLWLNGTSGTAAAYAYAPLYYPSVGEWAAFASYGFRVKKLRVSASINVLNIFDQQIPTPLWYAPNGREIRCNMKIQF